MRIRAEESGSWELDIRANGQTMSKRLIVGAIPLSKVSPAKAGANWVGLLLNPGEGEIPVSPVVERIEIQYPEAAFFGGHVHWLMVFFTLSVLLGFALN